MVILRIAGLILVLGLIGWIGVVLVFQIGRHPAPEVLGLGSGFEGNLQLPAETIKSVFETVRLKMLATNDWGSSLRLGGDIAGWLSFAATAAITLIVGFYGRASASPTRPPTLKDFQPAASVRSASWQRWPRC